MAIHPSRLPDKRPPTVAELIEKLSKCPGECYVVLRGPGNTVNAPHPKVRPVYQDATGWVRFQKVDAIGKIKHIKAVVL